MIQKAIFIVSLSGLLYSSPVFSQEDKSTYKTDNELLKKPNLSVNPNAFKMKSDGYVQQVERFDFKDNYKSLALNDVLEQGLRKNHEQAKRESENEILDLGWKDTWEDFWVPTLDITLSSGEQALGKFREGGKSRTGRDNVPDGTLGLNIGDYTIFNWGKDYLDYLNAKATYKRNTEILKEQRRELRHNLIIKYFEVYRTKEIEKIRKNQLRHSSFIYRMNREKITIRKIPRQDYYQARAEYLKAQNDYHDAKIAATVADEQMAFLLADDPGTRYILLDELDYKQLNLAYTEAIELGKNNNPNILTARTLVENAKRTYTRTLRENLPLPRLSMNLGAYTHSFGRNQHRTRYETTAANGTSMVGSGTSDIELVATVNATWTLTGSGGLLNGRSTRTKLLQRDLAFQNLAQSAHYTGSTIRTHYNRISNYQNQITILEARMANLQKSFDTVLENYINRKTIYENFHTALNEMTETEILYTNTLYNHLAEKVELAKSVGLEDFPGENFESVAKKVQKR
ncbi:MAG: outer membrane protein TolC [Bacteriovoracaceae bacterium]